MTAWGDVLEQAAEREATAESMKREAAALKVRADKVVQRVERFASETLAAEDVMKGVQR